MPQSATLSQHNQALPTLALTTTADSYTVTNGLTEQTAVELSLPADVEISHQQAGPFFRAFAGTYQMAIPYGLTTLWLRTVSGSATVGAFGFKL
jgi:hypothetical protein